MTDYRFDNRSKNQFKKDIKDGSSKEAFIAVRICIDEYNKSKRWPKLIPNGVDFTGQFIKNSNQVNSDPDFKINNILVEITRSDVVCKRYFHQKCGKLDRCAKEGYDLVFVNGYDPSKEPEYIRLSGNILDGFIQLAKKKYGVVPHPGGGNYGFTNKQAYRFDLSLFEGMWTPLPLIIKEIPKDYQNILNKLNYEKS